MNQFIRKTLSLIEWRAGIISGLVMGVLVWGINMMASTPSDWVGSTTAGIKQALYTLIMGGLLLKLAVWLSVRWDKALIAYPVAIIIPGCLATVLVYWVHTLRGTPEPMKTTILVAILSFIILPILVTKERKKLRNATH